VFLILVLEEVKQKVHHEKIVGFARSAWQLTLSAKALSF
jgi:hypothetical protein